MTSKYRFVRIMFLIIFLLPIRIFASEALPIIDGHIHYSHDAWEIFPPTEAISILRKAGLKKAFVSSSSDEGTQKLYAEAPDFIVPVLRPYRKRGEIGTWMYDETVPAMLSGLLDKGEYFGIGEFHAFGDDVDLPVLQSVIALAKKHRLFLHAHSDVEAVERIFKTNPDAIVMWAHSGFDGPETIRALLQKHKNLWSDLAFRSEYELGGVVDSEWQKLFEDFPDRFVLGTDTYTPERWYYVVEQADWSRGWLSSLPQGLAENIAYRNAENLLIRTKQ